MARTVRDANLETRAARLRLKPSDTRRREPYWRTLDQGAHLGYYKGDRGGAWVARLYTDGKYRKITLGIADDTSDADDHAVLDFKQAQAKARAWFSEQRRRADGLEPVAAGPYRVRDAVTDYLAWFKDHRRGLVTARTFAHAHIVPSLGDLELSRLTSTRIQAWHEALATQGVRKRSKDGKAPRQAAAPTDADGKRQRRATANRVLGVLKAALNRAWRGGKIGSDEAWRRVKPFRDADSAVVRYLTEAECVRLVNAASIDFRPLVRAALLTGCRYSELTGMRAADFNRDSGTVLIRASKSGKARHVVLTDEGRQFFGDMTAGKIGDATVFSRLDPADKDKATRKGWGKSDQQRPLTAACKVAKISPAVSFHVLRHTHASTLAMKGVPMGVIAAQLGHADERMTQRHYAHLAPSYVADTIRAHFPTLGILDPSNVTEFAPKAAG